MADLPEVNKLPLDGPSPNKPASGTYGENAAVAQLQAQLPPVQERPPTAALPPITSTPARPLGDPPRTPEGLPPGLVAPTRFPDVPVATPLAAPPVNPVAAAQSGREARLLVLQSLASAPNVSAVTREWAQTLVQAYLRGGQG